LGVSARGRNFYGASLPCLERRRGPDGKLAGIGSLIVGDAAVGVPGNMFVPIDRLPTGDG
jgi:hypothetical protein